MAFPNNTPDTEEEDASSERSGSRLTIWLVILGLGLLFLPLYLIANTIRESSVSLQADLDSVQATLAYTPPPNPSAEALVSTLGAVQRQNALLNSLQSTLVALHIDWPAVMAVIGNYDAAHMTLTAVTQTTTGVTIAGQADTQGIIANYADMLRQSGLFEQVSIGSITVQNIPTATPTKTPTPLPDSTTTPEPVVTQAVQSVDIFQITATIKSQTE